MLKKQAAIPTPLYSFFLMISIPPPAWIPPSFHGDCGAGRGAACYSKHGLSGFQIRYCSFPRMGGVGSAPSILPYGTTWVCIACFPPQRRTLALASKSPAIGAAVFETAFLRCGGVRGYSFPFALFSVSRSGWVEKWGTEPLILSLPC